MVARNQVYPAICPPRSFLATLPVEGEVQSKWHGAQALWKSPGGGYDNKRYLWPERLLLICPVNDMNICIRSPHFYPGRLSHGQERTRTCYQRKPLPGRRYAAALLLTGASPKAALACDAVRGVRHDRRATRTGTRAGRLSRCGAACRPGPQLGMILGTGQEAFRVIQPSPPPWGEVGRGSGQVGAHFAQNGRVGWLLAATRRELRAPRNHPAHNRRGFPP